MMNRKKLSIMVVLAVLFGTAYMANTGTARADLPESQTVHYYIHEPPTDPDSAVVFAVRLDLASVDSDEGWVGWKIASAEFRQPGGPGELDAVWTKDLPEIDTIDGLWWVKHADPTAPKSSEFSMPPRLLGMASAETSWAADLVYDVEGVEYAGPPERVPYDDLVALTYSFTEDGDPAPTEEGQDEPVEVPNGYHDPD